MPIPSGLGRCIRQCSIALWESIKRKPLRTNEVSFQKSDLQPQCHYEIDLRLSLYNWAKFRRVKGAIKLHLLLDHQGYLHSWGLVSDGKAHEVKIAQKLDFPADYIVVMDRGYLDFNLLAR